MNLIETLLRDPRVELEHRTRRGWFEKRIVRAGEERYVLYRFLRKAHAQRLAWMLRNATTAGASLQRHLGGTESWQAAFAYNGYWVVTSYETGSYLEGVGTSGNMSALGELLAGLHSIEGPSSYRLFALRPRLLSHPRRLQREFGKAIRAGEPNHRERRHIRGWLLTQGRFLTATQAYQLNHGDLYGRNIIVQGDQRIVLVDYELAEFEPAGLELATALLRAFCGQSPTLRASLLGAYLAACPAKLKSTWEAHAAFFLVAAALRLSAKRRFRARRLARLGLAADAAREQADHYYGWARSMSTAHRDGTTSTEALLALCL